MIQNSTLFYADSIKSETKQWHQETEGLLIAKLKRIKSKEDYAGILHIFYGFFSPLQQQIERFIKEQQLPDMVQRRKTSLIENDFFELQIKMKPDICTHLPSIHNKLQAFGAFYVIEGSTLGGAHIAQMLKNNIFVSKASLTFFNGYGDHTLRMWQKFKEALNNIIHDESELQQVTDAANDTFRKLKIWIQNCDECPPAK